MKKTVAKKKRTPLQFKCSSCGERFVSNEYKVGMMLPICGVYPSATDKCPSCGRTAKRGVVYRPLIGSDEHKRWHDDAEIDNSIKTYIVKHD